MMQPSQTLLPTDPGYRFVTFAPEVGASKCSLSLHDTRSPTLLGRTIRPLPPIPKPVSSGLKSRPQTPNSASRRFRRLPSLPLNSPISDTSTSTRSSLGTSHNSTPATSVEDLNRPKSCPVSKSAPLATNDKLLNTPTPDNLFDMPPTPQTAKRRRMEKLHRHFGELIPDGEVNRIVPQSVNTKAKILREVRRSEIHIYTKAAAVAEKILVASSDEGEDECSACAESFDISYEGKHGLAGQPNNEDDYTWEVKDGTAFQVKDKRYGEMWVWDRQGHRREERDYHRVIKELRIL